MNPRVSQAFVAILLVTSLDAVEAAPVRWSDNGHFYDIISVPETISWDDASAAAAAAGGYLATLNSQAENDFVFNLVNNAAYWHNGSGPWLGGYQSPASQQAAVNWRWVTGEAWSYTNWGSGQPNHAGGRIEDKLQFGFGAFINNWNDIQSIDPTPDYRPTAYVVEWNTDPLQACDCLPGPHLTLLAQQPGQMRLDIAGQGRFNYALEKSSNLLLWTRLATNRSDSGLFSILQPFEPGAPQTYFRALSVSAADGLGASFIFDGKSFQGWDRNVSGSFRVADCAIVCGSPQQAPSENSFLCTTRQYTNFILRLDFKLVSALGTVNSGVQIRSKRVPGTQDVSGYQADLGDGWWGCLWDQSRRNVFLANANQSAVATVLKPDQWNTYVIRAEGPRLRFWINGRQTIDYTETDPTIPRFGVIGLQNTAGFATEASFRRISLEVLP